MKKKGCKKQYGGNLGFDANDPYFDRPALDPYLDTLKSAGAAFLGNRISSKAYFDWLYPNDSKKADDASKRSAVISGLLGAGSSIVTQYGEKRAYERNMEWLQKRKAKDYYRLPYDRYSYNENLANPYNQTAYKKGGKVRMRYQDGGSPYGGAPYGGMPDDEDTELYPDNEQSEYGNEQVVLDSTFQDTPYQSQGYEDELPMNDTGDLDLSALTPTLGNQPLRYSLTADDISSAIDEIGQHESGGNYSAVNTSGGANALYATGKYQFVPKYWHKEIAQFQGTEGKSQEETMAAFRRSPAVQEAFMRHVTNKYYLPEVQSLLPLARQYGIDQKGLIKMLHYRGIQDTRRRLETGDFSLAKSEKALYNNPDILAYVRG